MTSTAMATMTMVLEDNSNTSNNLWVPATATTAAAKDDRKRALYSEVVVPQTKNEQQSFQLPRQTSLEDNDEKVSEETATSSSRKKQRRFARVRFNLDETQVQYHETRQDIIDELQDESKLWFTAKELQYIRAREAQAVQRHQSSAHFMEQVSSLMQLSTHKTTNSGEEEDETAENSSSSSATSASTSDASLWIANSDARGLERETLSAFRKQRKDAIASLIKSQKALKQWRGGKDGTHQFSMEFQSKALSQHYQRLTRPSLKIAQWLGQADADIISFYSLEDYEELEGLDELDLETFEW